VLGANGVKPARQGHDGTPYLHEEGG